MTETFTETLRRQHHETWDAAVNHRFVTELFDGSIDDAVMAGYLVQDYRFLDSFLLLLGSAVATADGLPPRLTFGRFIGEVAGDENTYFEKCFEAFGVTPAMQQQIPDTKPTSDFTSLMREAADTREYAAILAVLTVAEWLYLDWATRAPEPLPENFVHADWIRLHDYPAFHDLVAFLRSELDRVGPDQRELAEDFFGRAVQIELAFFDAAYDSPLPEVAR